MDKNIFGVVLVAVFFALSFPAAAQQAKKIPVIGFLEGASISESQGIEPFRQGLRDLGYVDGQNIIVEVRAIEGKPDRIPDIVAEFRHRKVDLIFSAFTSGAQAAKKATPTIPIVVVAADPVGAGLVRSLANPGGNVTGLSGFSELVGKRLEILKDVLPNLSRVAVFWTPTKEQSVYFQEMESAAGLLRLKLQLIQVRGPEDFESAFTNASKESARALIPLRSPMLVNHRKQFLKLVEEHRLPARYDDRNFVEPGGLMSYGTDRADLFRRAAVYVDKILKGAKPADLPVEQPMKFEFVINLKTAKQIGLTIPPNVLARADRVIK
ncbi:MAG TPA: ABC transporter substrate-binding protein [Candidatus Binatia bacterium]|jgi:putative ABC transport system substrate-binding protein|nr:ABC transporter substrate-binding protein [Candidatus Binatia bacterium]